MRPSTPLEFPGSRYVAGWWKQLAPLRPRAFWVAHLLFHHVEALVRTSSPVEPDGLTRLLLQAMPNGDSLNSLADRLCVRPAMLHRLLHQLSDEGLAVASPGAGWALTALGRQALEQGKYVRPRYERRLFHFVQNELGQPPHYLQAPNLQTAPWNGDPQWAFEVGCLKRSAKQPAAWKEQHAFPGEVEEVVDETVVPGAASAWQSVIVDRPGHLVAALVLAPSEHGERLLGFAVAPEGWALHAREAAFIVHSGWQEAFPDLAREPAPEVWREAWQAWCQRRGLPTVEADECILERQDHRIRVRARGRLVERLRSARSEALKGEAWLLAGSGRLRLAAQLEVTGGL